MEDKEVWGKIREIGYLLEYQLELRSVGNDLSTKAKAKLGRLLADFGYRKLPKDKLPDCDNCFYKNRYTPNQLYDSDFGRITGTQRPKKE